MNLTLEVQGCGLHAVVVQKNPACQQTEGFEDRMTTKVVCCLLRRHWKHMGMIVLEDAFTVVALIVMDSELSLNEFDIEN